MRVMFRFLHPKVVCRAIKSSTSKFLNIWNTVIIHKYSKLRKLRIESNLEQNINNEISFSFHRVNTRKYILVYCHHKFIQICLSDTKTIIVKHLNKISSWTNYTPILTYRELRSAPLRRAPTLPGEHHLYRLPL